MTELINLKNMNQTIFKIMLVTLFFASCGKQKDIITEKKYFIFGTIVEVVISHQKNLDVSLALNEVEVELNSMHTKWHAWQPGRLQDINHALQNNEIVELNTEELSLISSAKELAQQSNGNFNPAIGRLINLWGFHTSDYPILEPPPTNQQILGELANLPSMSDLKISGNFISSVNPNIWLDFGGIAKGYAIDRVILILKDHGIENAIVNAGGDLRSVGFKNSKGWKIAIRKPNSENVIGVIQTNSDESIFTSGNYERYKKFEAKRYSHIINPKTGYGINDIVSATVVAENGTKADAAATAFVVGGVGKFSALIKSMQISQALLIKDDGTCIATKEIWNRITQPQLKCQVIEK